MIQEVTSILKKYRSINPPISEEDTESAIRFYKEAFSAKEKLRRPILNEKSILSELQIGDMILRLPDHFSIQSFKYDRARLMCISSSYIKDVDAVFESAIQAGAKISSRLRSHSWGRWGQLLDPFGHFWGCQGWE